MPTVTLAARALFLFGGALAVACGPPSDARDAASLDRKVIDNDALEIDESWMAAWPVPDFGDRPFVIVRGESLPEILMSETRDSFTVRDGRFSRTLLSRAPTRPQDAEPTDEAPPDLHSYERIDAARVGTSFANASKLDDDDQLRAIVFAVILKRRGERAAVHDVLGGLAKNPNELRAVVMTFASDAAIIDVLRAWHRGASLVDVDRMLARIAAAEETLGAKGGGHTTKHLMNVFRLRGPPLDNRTWQTPVDLLVHQRIDALASEVCTAPEGLEFAWREPDAVERLVALGATAMDALEVATSDKRLSRCVSGLGSRTKSGLEGICSIDPEACSVRVGLRFPTLTTVGALAQRAKDGILRGRSGSAYDPSDVECDRNAGEAKELVALVQAALDRDDLASAIAITRRARGRARPKMVKAIAEKRAQHAARVLDDLVELGLAFLVDEAEGAPVFAARFAAVDALRDARDARWARLGGVAVDAAFRASSPIRMTDRCDAAFVRQLFAKVVGSRAKEALEPIVAGFPSYPTHVRVEVVREVLDHKRPLSSEATAIASAALSDTKTVHGLEIFASGWGCRNPSPSDVAATLLGRRVAVDYRCVFTAEEKARLVDAIRAKRGAPGGW